MMSSSRLSVEAVTTRTDLVGAEIRFYDRRYSYWLEYGTVRSVRRAKLFGQPAVRVVYSPGALDDLFKQSVVIAPGHVRGHRIAKNRRGRVRLEMKGRSVVLLPPPNRDH